VVNAGCARDLLERQREALQERELPLGYDGQAQIDADLTDDEDLLAHQPAHRQSASPSPTRPCCTFELGNSSTSSRISKNLYVSYRFLEYKVKKGGYYVPFGNPNLKPEMTTAY